MATKSNNTEATEQDILLLHQLEAAIVSIIDKEYRATGIDYIVCAWKVLINLMPEYRAFQAINVKPHLARGLIAEIMCKCVFTEWAKSKNLNYIYKSNLLIPRCDGKGSAQLDAVFATDRFSAVIECKSFHGKINIVDGTISSTTKKIDPWKQNYGHIISLKALVEEQVKLYFHNIVYIFSEGMIVNYEKKPEDYLMVNKVAFSLLDTLYDNNENADTLSESELSILSSILDEYTPTVEQEAEHIDFVHTLIGNQL